MVVQYPHQLYRAQVGKPSVQDADGNWTQQEVEMEYLGPCRHETGGKGTKLNLGGGRYVEVSSTLYLPKNCVSVSPGEVVVVYVDVDRTFELTRGEVLGFSNDQLHQRIWI